MIDTSPISVEATTAQEQIPLCIPQIDGNEWIYVKECLDTGWVSSVGSYVTRFEEQLAAVAGCQYAVATSSGTAALHTSLVTLGIEPDDEVIVSALTFVASANAIRYVGAWPVFMDVTREYWQMDPQKLSDFLEQECHWVGGELRNNHTGRPVRAIMPVHILGHPVDLAPILDLAQQYNLYVIEDATESLGARYKGHPVGQLGHMASFSFNGNKLMTTGGGGMITTNNPEWADRAKYLSTQAKDDPLEYIHHSIGYNYRLTNIQAALGCAQLEQLGNFVDRKQRIAMAYAEGLSEINGITPMPEADWATSVWWLYTVLIDEEQCGISSRQMLRALSREAIQTRPLWRPLPMLPLFQQDNSFDYRIEVAPWLYQRALSLPCSVGLTSSEQNRVIDAIRALC